MSLSLALKELAASVVTTTREYIDARFAALPVPRDGKDGAKGLDGAPGEPGAAGRDGVDGTKGLDGAAGRDGVDGTKGLDGAAGKDGVDGAKGLDGAQGPQGETGPAGPAGRDGIDGTDGAAGRDGVDGTKGLDGRDGREGKDGEDGRDALDIDILPSLDPAKKYRRGTWASHAGGLWVSRKQTDGMDGWDCVVEGVAEVLVTHDGERNASIEVVRSSGARSIKTVTLPAMIYRGLYREGDTYERGDTVTWGGAQWHCNEPTDIKPIEGGKAWTLAVRKGRDGREGPEGKPGGKGLDGRDGKDLTSIGPDGRKWG